MNAHARCQRVLAVAVAVVCLPFGHDLARAHPASAPAARDLLAVALAQAGEDPPPRRNNPRGYQPTNIAKRAQFPLPSGDVPKPAPAQRPWWDLLGVTRTETKVHQVRPKSSAAAGNATRSPSGMPKLKVVEDPKPWWDWLGVTQKDKKSNRSRVLRVGPKQPEKPWWDWMGVTQEPKKTNRSVVHRAHTTKVYERPWWDWLGATDPPARRPGPSRPRTRLGPQPAPQKPWWDLMGVTDSSAGKKKR